MKSSKLLSTASVEIKGNLGDILNHHTTYDASCGESSLVPSVPVGAIARNYQRHYQNNKASNGEHCRNREASLGLILYILVVLHYQLLVLRINRSERAFFYRVSELATGFVEICFCSLFVFRHSTQLSKRRPPTTNVMIA